MFAGKKSAQIREILISESAWEEMTCLFAPSLAKLDEIVKQFKIPADKIQTHAVTGSPKDQILKLADTIGADLIIVASHKPDISTYLLGSNAAAVVRHAKCPVLVVR